MFIDLDISTKFGFDTMIYHLKENLIIGEYLARKAVKLILFLN